MVTGGTSQAPGSDLRDLGTATTRLDELQATAEARIDMFSLAEARRLARARRTLSRNAARLSRAPLPLARRRDRLYRSLVRSHNRVLRAARLQRFVLSLLLFRNAVAWFIHRYWPVILFVAVSSTAGALAYTYRVEIAALFDAARQWLADFRAGTVGGAGTAPGSGPADPSGGAPAPELGFGDTEPGAAGGAEGN